MLLEQHVRPQSLDYQQVSLNPPRCGATRLTSSSPYIRIVTHHYGAIPPSHWASADQTSCISNHTGPPVFDVYPYTTVPHAAGGDLRCNRKASAAGPETCELTVALQTNRCTFQHSVHFHFSECFCVPAPSNDRIPIHLCNSRTYLMPRPDVHASRQAPWSTMSKGTRTGL